VLFTTTIPTTTFITITSFISTGCIFTIITNAASKGTAAYATAYVQPISSIF